MSELFKILGIVFGLFIALVVFKNITGQDSGGTSAASGSVAARATCWMAIESIAFDPDSVDFPIVRDSGTPTEHRFTWDRSNMIRMKNRLGNEVPVTADCAVSAATGRVTHLVMDGRAYK